MSATNNMKLQEDKSVDEFQFEDTEAESIQDYFAPAKIQPPREKKGEK